MAGGAAVAPTGRLVGAVTRQILDAALQHGLGERPVETVMDPDLEWVEPDSPADDVGRRILDRHPRFVLVGDRAGGRAAGLITRMQVLRHLHGRLAAFEERIDRRSQDRAEERQGIGELLAERLSPALRRAGGGRRPGRAGHGIPVYLVGGLVRDLLLGRDNRDLDLVVEGDGLALRPRLAAELGGRVREHRAFLTAVVVDGEGFHVDVASARSEFYRAPAALPEVQTSAIRQDLFRRDFTINTLAIRLGSGGPAGTDRLLRRPPRPRGEDRPGAAQPVVHRRPDPGAARGPPGAAARLPDLAGDPPAGRGGARRADLRPPLRARGCARS